jgi:hypothetical protein
VRPDDLASAEGKEWLLTDQGEAWLESDEGIEWLNTGDGEDWMGSRGGRAWMEAGQDKRWDEYISGKSPAVALPEWALTPETAPQVGSRVRFVNTDRTIGGVEFQEGELGIVIEARFTPMGAVFITVRTLDGRKQLTGMRGVVEDA